MKSKAWTPAEDAVLAAAPAGATYDDLAAVLGRTPRAVMHRFGRLRVAAAERGKYGRPRAAPRDPRDLPAERRCLGCRGDFASTHAGNRLCPRCLTRAESQRSAIA